MTTTRKTKAEKKRSREKRPEALNGHLSADERRTMERFVREDAKQAHAALKLLQQSELRDVGRADRTHEFVPATPEEQLSIAAVIELAQRAVAMVEQYRAAWADLVRSGLRPPGLKYAPYPSAAPDPSTAARTEVEGWVKLVPLPPQRVRGEREVMLEFAARAEEIRRIERETLLELVTGSRDSARALLGRYKQIVTAALAEQAGPERAALAMMEVVRPK